MRLLSLVLLVPRFQVFSGVWLYIGPDVFMPLTSALAAVAGVLLMFWNRVVAGVGRLLGRKSDRESDSTLTDRPS